MVSRSGDTVHDSRPRRSFELEIRKAPAIHPGCFTNQSPAESEHDSELLQLYVQSKAVTYTRRRMAQVAALLVADTHQAAQCVVDTAVTRWYRCVTRCVRRAFLLGEKTHNPGEWIEHRPRTCGHFRALSAVSPCGPVISLNPGRDRHRHWPQGHPAHRESCTISKTPVENYYSSFVCQAESARTKNYTIDFHTQPHSRCFIPA